MEDTMTSIESEISAVLDRRAAAIGARDIERLMSLYSPDIVYFDLVPPLRYVGSDALRSRFLDWFGRWETGIGQQTSSVNICMGGEVAAADMLIRTSGTLAGGRQVGYWVRVSNSLQRSERGWQIIHEHVSLPVDMRTGKAVMDLLP
jgi:ketosteroid isomerase-like protein